MYEIEKLAELFGSYQWAKGFLIAEKCPLCGELWSFRFYGGSGLWECCSCHPGLGEYDALIDTLRKDLVYSDRLANIHKPKPPAGLLLPMQMETPPAISRIPTGFSELDKNIGGLAAGFVTVITGKRGEGKSTFASQLALSAINAGKSVFFYSGELGAWMFRQWMMVQAAGPHFLNSYTDEFGAQRYQVDEYAEPRIRGWIGNKLVLYDNTVVNRDEHDTVLDRAKTAIQFYGCELVFIDNLMTVPIHGDGDFFRKQAEFINRLGAFALTYNVHSILIAHPRKGSEGDPNDSVGGSSAITDRARNVLRIERASEKEKTARGCDSVLSITKQTEFGTVGSLYYTFDPACRRLKPMKGGHIEKYGWENQC